MNKLNTLLTLTAEVFYEQRALVYLEKKCVSKDKKPHQTHTLKMLTYETNTTFDFDTKLGEDVVEKIDYIIKYRTIQIDEQISINVRCNSTHLVYV